MFAFLLTLTCIYLEGTYPTTLVFRDRAPHQSASVLWQSNISNVSPFSNLSMFCEPSTTGGVKSDIATYISIVFNLIQETHPSEFRKHLWTILRQRRCVILLASCLHSVICQSYFPFVLKVFSAKDEIKNQSVDNRRKKIVYPYMYSMSVKT